MMLTRNRAKLLNIEVANSIPFPEKKKETITLQGSNLCGEH